jgi:hypothetical protein
MAGWGFKNNKQVHPGRIYKAYFPIPQTSKDLVFINVIDIYIAKQVYNLVAKCNAAQELALWTRS